MALSIIGTLLQQITAPFHNTNLKAALILKLCDKPFVNVAVKPVAGHRGIFLGAGAAFTENKAMIKAVAEAEFFEWWHKRQSDNKPKSKDSFAGIMNFYAFDGQGVVDRLLTGSEPSIVGGKHSKLLTEFCRLFWLRSVAQIRDPNLHSKLFIMQALGAGFLPQHCSTGINLIPHKPLVGFDGDFDLVPINGEQPLT